MNLKNILKNILPPFVWNLFRSLFLDQIKFEGTYSDWYSASQASEGYDSESILSNVCYATSKVKAGDFAFERDAVLFEKGEYPFPLITVLLHAAIENGGRLNVLDFGGALGSSYYQCRSFLGVVAQLRWCVVEQTHFVECGKREFENGVLSFYESVDAVVGEVSPDVVLVSGVLQYIPEPEAVLQALIRMGASYIVIDRTPFADDGKQVISVQKVPKTINRSSYPLWLFSEEALKKPLLQTYTEIASFDAVDGVLGVGKLKAHFKGMVFRKIAPEKEK